MFFKFSITCKRTNNANNATHYVKLGNKRRESFKRNYFIVSLRVIIKAIIIILSTGACAGMYVVQVSVDTSVCICEHTLRSVCSCMHSLLISVGGHEWGGSASPCRAPLAGVENDFDMRKIVMFLVVLYFLTGVWVNVGVRVLMMIAFITIKSSLVPLIEGLCAQIYFRFEISVVCSHLLLFVFVKEKIC